MGDDRVVGPEIGVGTCGVGEGLSTPPALSKWTYLIVKSLNVVVGLPSSAELHA